MKALIVQSPRNYRRHPCASEMVKVQSLGFELLFLGWLTGIEIRSSPSSPLKRTVLIRTAHLAKMTTTPIANQTWERARLGG